MAKLVIVNRDITEGKRAEQQLVHNRFHDPLTGLPNRSVFLDRLQQLFARTGRDPNHPYAMLLANVDHFKVFNETLGTASSVADPRKCSRDMVEVIITLAHKMHLQVIAEGIEIRQAERLRQMGCEFGQRYYFS